MTRRDRRCAGLGGGGRWRRAGRRRAAPGDPTRVYRTVETEHFVIYYWAPLDDVARRVARGRRARAPHAVAGARSRARRRRRSSSSPTTPTARTASPSVLPRNAIQLYATGPTGFSELDDHDDWLYGLVAHEYTHILHLDTMEGLPNIYNSIFGKTWAPNQIMPRWVIEGIAVYEESQALGGRPQPRHALRPVHPHRAPRRTRTCGSTRSAARRASSRAATRSTSTARTSCATSSIGSATTRCARWRTRRARYAPPFAVNRQIAKVVGKPFTELYDDWKRYLRDRYGMQEMAAERRGLRDRPRAHAHRRERTSSPHYSRRRHASCTGCSTTATRCRCVRAMPVGGDATRRARRRADRRDGAVRPARPTARSSTSRAGSTAATTRSRTCSGGTRAPARSCGSRTGRRARDPAVSPDGRRVAFSHERARRERARGDGRSRPTRRRRSCGAASATTRRTSRRGRPTARGSRSRRGASGGYRDILIVELAIGHGRARSRTTARSTCAGVVAPTARYVYFDSDRTGISNIYAYDTARSLDVAGHERARRRVPRRSRRPTARGSRSRPRCPPAATTCTSCRSIARRWLPGARLRRRQAAAGR